MPLTQAPVLQASLKAAQSAAITQLPLPEDDEVEVDEEVDVEPLLPPTPPPPVPPAPPVPMMTVPFEQAPIAASASETEARW
jgi:hypothetical protein